jgi:hypothetical protein
LGREVCEAIWNWREAATVAAAAGSGAAVLRRAALVQALVMGAIGLLLHFVLGHELLARIVWALAGVIVLLGLVAPPAYRPIHRFGRWLGRIVGVALIYVLLVPFFYLFFFAVSLILRLQRRDPMQRSSLPAGLTYWIPRRHESAAEQYERQFLREDKEARGLRRPLAGALAEADSSGGAGGDGGAS